MVADLVNFARCVVASDNTTYAVIAFWSCRLVASETRQTAHCRTVVLSPAKHAKRRVVIRRFVAMSPCRLTYKPILRFEPTDNVTSRQHAARQRAV
jgi:hypothetical protein